MRSEPHLNRLLTSKDRLLWNRGLPAFVSTRQRRKDLAARCAGWWALSACVSLALFFFTEAYAPDEFVNIIEDQASLEDEAALVLFAILLGAAAVGIPVLVWGIQRFLLKKFRTLFGLCFLVLAVVCPVASSAIAHATDSPWVARDSGAPFSSTTAFVSACAEALFVPVLVYLFAWLGFFRLGHWTLIRAFRELPRTVAESFRTIPLLLVAFLFSFLNSDIWKLANQITVGRVLGIGLTLWLIAAGAAVIGIIGQLSQVTSMRKLRWRERLNLHWCASAVQLSQASIMGFTLFLGFVLLGIVTMPVSVINNWLTVPPATLPVFALNYQLPIVTLKVSWMLAAFGTLYFVTNA